MRFPRKPTSLRFQAWVRARLEEDIPYDQFVERILLATSRESHSPEEYAEEVKTMMEGYAPGRPDLKLYSGRRTLDLYWQRRGADGVGGALQVAHAFLGLRLECAECHRHPHDVWQQDDLLDFANFFMRVRKVGFKGDNEKCFPDMAALKKRFDDEAKKLETEVKKAQGNGEQEARRGGEEGKGRGRQVERSHRPDGERATRRRARPRLRGSGRNWKGFGRRSPERSGFGRRRRNWRNARSCCPRSAGDCSRQKYASYLRVSSPA